MIFGKTYEQRHKEEQEELEFRYHNPKTWFAWYPVGLNTGEVVWLEHVKVIEPIYKSYDGYTKMHTSPARIVRIIND